jgi:hypothetical protein
MLERACVPMPDWGLGKAFERKSRKHHYDESFTQVRRFYEDSLRCLWNYYSIISVIWLSSFPSIFVFSMLIQKDIRAGPSFSMPYSHTPGGGGLQE